jgi:hypothetical protein
MLAEPPKVEANLAVTVTPSAQSRIPCADPVAIPDRSITEMEATNLWGRDRGALQLCEQKRKAAISAIDAAGGDL